MLRWLGAVLVVGGCSGLGFWFRGQLAEGLKQLQCLRQMLEMMMSEIRYHRSTLPECCRQVGKKVEEPYGSSLLDIYHSLQASNGSGFSESWLREMGRCLEKIPISDREREYVLGIAQCEGFCDCDMQLRAIEQYRDMLDSSVKSREAQLHQQGRVAAGLGIMSGLLLVIILI